MRQIKQYINLLKKINIRYFVYLNYFCKSIIRTDNYKIIPYKNSIIDLAPNSKIYLCGGDIELGCDLMRKSKAETRVRLQKNAIWNSVGGSKISYGSTIELQEDAILDTEYFTMNSNSTIVAAKRITFGKDVMISRNVLIYDSDFHSILDIDGNCKNKSRPVVIGSHVWLSANVTVLKGTIIGEGSIIGLNSVVSNTVQENTIVQTVFEKRNRINEGAWDRRKPEK